MRRHLPGTPRRLRKRQSKRREPRAGCANAKTNAARLARVAQTPRQTPGTLRCPRKRQSKCRRTCAGCANAKANAAERAQAAQTSKQMPQDLRRLGCANAKANAAGLAQAAQTPKQMPRDLRGLRKRRGKRRETRAGCVVKPALIQHHGPLGVAAQLVDHADILQQGAVERERRQAVESEKTLVEDVERAG